MISFGKLDEVLIELPKDINRIIYGYLNDGLCEKCKKGCDTCDFCSQHRDDDFYCKCCCLCNMSIGENWRKYYEHHTGEVLTNE